MINYVLKHFDFDSYDSRHYLKTFFRQTHVEMVSLGCDLLTERFLRLACKRMRCAHIEVMSRGGDLLTERCLRLALNGIGSHEEAEREECNFHHGYVEMTS